jgi:hypothetical protein
MPGRLTYRQVPPGRVGAGSAEPPKSGKAMEAEESLESAAVRDSSVYGARNVSRVAAGPGEALPGPATCGVLLPERGVS